jgi:hypothetical protein
MVTSFGLGEIIRNQLATGRIAKWVLDLVGFDVQYVPQTAIKSQALADFVAEWSKTQQPPPQLPTSIGACTSMTPSPSTVPGEV